MIHIPSLNMTSAYYNYSIDRGDGTPVQNLTSYSPSHTYTTAGNYQIKIKGKF